MADENESVNEFTASDYTAVVTGANSGIGLAAAVALARRGGQIALVGRDQRRLDDALSTVRAAAAPGSTVEQFRADFADFAQVRKLAEQLSGRYPRIDLLANNAGIVVPSRVTTVDGHELTIQANHLSPFLLTNLLRDRLAGGRVVNTASAAHTAGQLDPADLDSDKLPYKAFNIYGGSKQANIMFAAEAARRWPEIFSTAYHPGVVRTRFGRDSKMIGTFYKLAFFLRSPEKGADTLLWLATEPTGSLTNGGYYFDRKPAKPSAPTTDPARAAALWTASEAAVGLT